MFPGGGAAGIRQHILFHPSSKFTHNHMLARHGAPASSAMGAWLPTLKCHFLSANLPPFSLPLKSHFLFEEDSSECVSAGWGRWDEIRETSCIVFPLPCLTVYYEPPAEQDLRLSSDLHVA